MEKELPKIKKVVEVGDAPFQFVQKMESILQGWDSTIKKTIYLFKTENGGWGYFDKGSQEVIEVTQWSDKSAYISDHYVKMTLYHRLHVKFQWPVTYSDWDPRAHKATNKEATEAIITITATAYNSLVEQMKGREASSFYQLVFTTKKIGGRQVSYVEKIIWVG